MLRFAPSPTGNMHIGDLRIAILNYLYAQQKGEEFIVRIEDSSKRRNVPGKDEEFLMILEKFALPHAQLYYQNENLHIHQTLAIRLLEENKAFICLCQEDEETQESKYSGACENITTTQLAKLKEEKTPFVLRLRRPQEDIVIDDLIKGESINSPDAIDSFVIMYADGSVSELFATACDDMLSGVKTIMREDKHLNSTPKEHHIQKMLGYSEETTYIHLPTLLSSDDKKMSENPILVKSLLEEGYLPDAIINYLIAIGHETAQKIFTLPEAIEWFDIQKVLATPQFDSETLRSINREHLRMMEDKKLSSLFGFADSDIGKLAKVYLDEVSTINELKSKIEPIFAKKECSGEWGELMATLQKLIIEAPMFTEFDAFKAYLIKHSKLDEKSLMIPLRLLMTGVEDEVELNKIYPFIKSYITEVVA
ncbi:MAG: glutamate--tRNA ligase family protein [Campylobacterota bacterium]|nr:glutamate--tRNA ligase family protein [Campylobacterota bacterium]